MIKLGEIFLKKYEKEGIIVVYLTEMLSITATAFTRTQTLLLKHAGTEKKLPRQGAGVKAMPLSYWLDEGDA